MRARQNTRAPGGKRDAFRFPLLETWVATLVYSDGREAKTRALRQAAEALHEGLVSGELPRVMATQRFGRILSRDFSSEEVAAMLDTLPRFGDVRPTLEVVPAVPPAADPVEDGPPLEVVEAPSSPQPTYAVVSFRDVQSREPVAQVVTWPELAGMLGELHVADAKDAVMLWSPVLYVAGKTRGACNVDHVSLIVQDFDDGTHWRDVLPRWEGHAAIVHTSWSHTPEHPKWRLVLPLAAPVPAADWLHVWAWADKRSGGADPACKDPSRIYYIPAAPQDRAEHFVHIVQEGALVAPPPVIVVPPTKRSVWAATARVHKLEHARSGDARPGEIYKVDAAARQALGERLGGRIQGQAVKRIPCPSCGKRSVAWYIEPGRKLQAWCNHKRTCGWSGWLDELEG